MHIHRDTVTRTLKKTSQVNGVMLAECQQNSNYNAEIQIHCTCEPDEFRSFVGCKSNQRWTWYAMESSGGRILAWHNGKRSDRDFLKLWKLLEPFPVAMCYTDDRGRNLCFIPVPEHHPPAVKYVLDGMG